MTEIIITIISGVLTLVGVCATAWTSNRKTAADLSEELKVSRAVTDTRIEELTREVRDHNNFARRMPVVEEKVEAISHRLSDLERKIEEINHRLSDLERNDHHLR